MFYHVTSHISTTNSMKSAKKSTSSSSASLKQGTLGFTSVKRTASNTQVKANKHLKSSEQEQIIQSVSSPETDDPIESSSSESEPHEVVREKKPIPKRRDTSRRQGVSRLRDGAEGDLGNLDLKNIPEKWRKHYGVVREKMGHLEPGEYDFYAVCRIIEFNVLCPLVVHSQGQTLIHHILRVFDL